MIMSIIVLVLGYLPVAVLCILYGAKYRFEVVRFYRILQLLRYYRLLTAGVKIENRLKDEADAWYTKPPLAWAHAGGGYPVIYGNSMQNFDMAIENGFKCLEIDIARTVDGIMVLSHLFMPNMEHQYSGTPTLHEFMGTKICDKYTPMSLDDFVVRYKDFDGKFFLDGLKFAKTECIDQFVNMVSPEFAKKCVVQISKFNDLLVLKGNRVFAGIHFNGIAGISENRLVRKLLIKALIACGVHSVSISDYEIRGDIQEIVADFVSANIHVSVAGVNTMSHYKRLCEAGVSCIDTDYLVPSDLKNESCP